MVHPRSTGPAGFVNAGAASLLLVLAGASRLPAQAQTRRPVPFDVGERLVYEVKFGPIKVGSGSMEVMGVQPVRGRSTWHTMFRVKGGTFFYSVDDRYESWFDVESLSSLRYVQDIDEGRYERARTFDIFPESSTFREQGKPPQASVAEPLDDGSFLYFVRTVPLRVGETYQFSRYFRPDRNPVTIRVLRRERISVPAGKFDAIVIRPVIKTKGIFSENGQAEIWLADDSTRIMLQMKSQLAFGSLNLYLKSYRPPIVAPPPPRPPGVSTDPPPPPRIPR
jgi:hypothetical protein